MGRYESYGSGPMVKDAELDSCVLYSREGSEFDTEVLHLSLLSKGEELGNLQNTQQDASHRSDQ